jgi:UDP-N-acetylmuramoyl-tripeptide--D-alanyl-D-alanine ligase
LFQLDPTTLREALADHLRGPLPDLPTPRSVTFDSRRVEPGVAFVALAGAHQHGLQFADEALARGAPYLISDRPHPRAVLVDDAAAALLTLGRYARARLHGPVIGITGSAGKTTAKSLLAAALAAPASPGNFNTPFALATVLIDAAQADPEAPLVLELGVDAPGDMALLTDLADPSDGLLTLIAPAHLQALGDLAGVVREKSALLRAAPRHRFASQQAFDQLPADLQPTVTPYRVATAAGWPSEAGVGHHQAETASDRLRAIIAGERVAVALPGTGRALAENALGVLLLAAALGVDPQLAAARIQEARLEPGRLQSLQRGELTLIDDSYNANPASMREALSLLQRAGSPRHAILGSMLELGSDSARYHRELADTCLACDLTSLVTVGSEARALADAAQALGVPLRAHFESVAALIAAGLETPSSGTLLVKGSRGIALERYLQATWPPKEPA